MAETVRLEGLDGLIESLNAMPADLLKKGGGPVAFGMRKGANIIRDEARQRAPKDSGFMAKQIVTKKMSAKSKRKAGADEYFTVGVKLGKKKKYANTKRNRGQRRAGRLYVTDGWAYYWRMVEFGTKKMAAQPFLTPAGESKGPAAAAEMIRQIRIGIDNSAKKHGWK